MDRQMQLYWEVYESLVSTEEILKADCNPVYQFDDQLVDGAIVDIGCGQTSSLIKYATNIERRLIGIDSEKSQLIKLRSRMMEVAGGESGQWELLRKDLRYHPLPDGTYAMVVLFNILHFFTLEYCKKFIRKLEQHLTSGSLLSICVHSTKYFANDPSNPNNNEYFKHYFSQEDLNKLFPDVEYEKLYSADIEKQQGKKDKEVSALWIERVIDDMKITNELIKADYRQLQKANDIQAGIVCVYKRR